MVLLPPPARNASVDEKVDFLQQQLDSFSNNTPIFADLMSLGDSGSERRRGGVPCLSMYVQVMFVLNLNVDSTEAYYSY